MMIRRIVGCMTIIFLLFGFRQANALPAGDINKPQILAGDEWIFIDSRSSKEISLKMIAKRGDIYIFEETTGAGKKELNYDLELNRVGGDKKLDFPLYPEKKWSWKKWIVGRATLVKAEFEVLASETHRVPAGSFETLKIRAVMDAYFLGFTHKWRGTVDFWYADCAGTIIDVAPDFKSEEIIPQTLKSYRFRNAPAECAP